MTVWNRRVLVPDESPVQNRFSSGSAIPDLLAIGNAGQGRGAEQTAIDIERDSGQKGRFFGEKKQNGVDDIFFVVKFGGSF